MTNLKLFLLWQKKEYGKNSLKFTPYQQKLLESIFNAPTGSQIRSLIWHVNNFLTVYPEPQLFVKYIEKIKK